MRVYSAAAEEALRTRRLLKEWAGDGLLTPEQYQVMEQDTACDLRTTNIFVRVVLFLFTTVVVSSGAALFLAVFFSRPSPQTTGLFLLIFAPLTYAAAELAVSQGRLYRYGIEEALAACSVGFLCAGMNSAFFSSYPASPGAVQCLVPTAGAALSLWIWRRFGLTYAFLAAMIFVASLPGYWTSSEAARHLMVAAFYAAGLAAVSALRSGEPSDSLHSMWSFVEAALWVGIYLAINLQCSSSVVRWRDGAGAVVDVARPFYWTTWVLIWCLPPIVLARGVRRKDRFIIDTGAILAILTLVTNKPYLGWPRHTWDPMLLGALLIGVALLLRRWLARGPQGIRQGFTAERLSRKHREWVDVGGVAAGLVAYQTTAPVPQAGAQEFRFGGGDSGGGGATGSF